MNGHPHHDGWFRILATWQWLLAGAIGFLWLVGDEWSRAAQHFGYETWPLLALLAAAALAPVIALVTGVKSIAHFVGSRIDKPVLAAQLIWSAAVAAGSVCYFVVAVRA